MNINVYCGNLLWQRGLALVSRGKGGWGRPEDLAKNLETTFKTLKALV